jgi:hypothetical protein
MMQQLPLAAEGRGSLSFWTSQVEQAQANIRNVASQRDWDANLQSYLGRGDRKRWGKNTTLVRKDYSLTEIKKAMLFYQLPDVAATAKKPEYEVAAPLVGAVVNQYLSPDYTHAMAMVDEVLMDLLCPAGIGVSKIGYESFVDPNLREVPAVNPLDPNVPALDQFGKPIMQPNVVRECYYWNRIPPKMFLYDPTFIGSDFDRAGWIGFKYRVSKAVAESVLELTREQIAAGSSVDLTKDLLASDVTRADQQSSANEDVSLYEIYYYAMQVDPLIGDPKIIRQLVLLEGKEDAPIIHRDCPYQTIEDGKMVAGMHGYPVHVFTLRYVSDQAIPPSDCSVSRDQVDELSRGRTQMIDQRDRAVPMTFIDFARVPKETQNKILKGEVQELIGVEGGMDSANPPAFALQRGQWPRENFSFNDIIGRDIAEAWSLGANQQGVDTDTKRTATELSIMQSGTDTRMDKERARFLRQFANGCQKLLALIQMFATDQDFARVADESGQLVLKAWDATAIAGEFGITLAPDSSQRIDAAVEKKRAIEMFSTFGNDPLVNQVELRKQVFRKLGFDPAKLVMPPQPKPPEKPQVSVSFKGEDLAPMMPQYVNVAALLSVLGIGMAPPVPMETPDPGTATNPGGVPPVTPINKRKDDDGSGKLPGAGMAQDVAQVGGR